MTHKLNVVDRLRIERVVWDLDQRIYNLPYRKRIAIRREVRDNLRTAASDIGAKAAAHNIGSVHQLAADYLDAQFGGRPRPSWIAAALFAFTAVLILQALLTEAALGFRDGVLHANPDYTGSMTWHGIGLIQSKVNYTFAAHHATISGGALSPLAWLLIAVGAIAIGRLWRALPTPTGPRRATAPPR